MWKFFNVNGENVNFICNVTDDTTLDMTTVKKRIKFPQELDIFHSNHVVLHNAYLPVGKQKLFWLRSVIDA